MEIFRPPRDQTSPARNNGNRVSEPDSTHALSDEHVRRAQAIGEDGGQNPPAPPLARDRRRRDENPEETLLENLHKVGRKEKQAKEIRNALQNGLATSALLFQSAEATSDLWSDDMVDPMARYKAYRS